MACQVKNDISINPVIELLSKQGFDGLAEAVSLLINQAMLIEREKQHLMNAQMIAKVMPMALNLRRSIVVLEGLL